jgi:hypothetical protein
VRARIGLGVRAARRSRPRPRGPRSAPRELGHPPPSPSAPPSLPAHDRLDRVARRRLSLFRTGRQALPKRP